MYIYVEKRWAEFGKTDSGRMLTVIFTKRGSLVRVISVRNMEKKRDYFMKKMNKKIPQFKNKYEEREFWTA
jgi:uncharacterized DUF497 family protein